MPNNSVRAAAEGMPAINRRRMLLGLAAASTVAAGGAVCVAGATAAAPTENPKLLELIEQLPAIAAAYHEAKERYQTEYKQWDAKTPWAPDELTELGTGWPYDVPNQPGDAEMKILGGFLWRKGDDFPRRIVIHAWRIDRQIWEVRAKKRRAKKAESLADFMDAEAEIKRLKKQYATARAHEREYNSLRAQASKWHEAAWPIKDNLQEALERHVAAIMNEPDHTMEGLLIKAQALAEWDRVGTKHFERVAHRHGQDWHGQIAASILRHAKGGAA